MTKSETAPSIGDQAAAWLARLDRASPGDDVRAELEAWLAGDDRRRGAFFRAEAAWAMLDRASVLGAGSPHAGDSERLPSAFAQPVDRRWLLWGGGAVAASVMGIAGLSLWRGRPKRIETALGEIRRVPLADGSVVAVNTASAVSVALEPAIRALRVDEGEAWFQVAKDRTRPFVVAAGDVRVRAVGTAFSVRRHARGADVQVTEGVVEAWSIGREQQVRRIVAGTRAYVSDVAGPAAPVEASIDIDRTLAWRGGQVVFDGDTLATAAAEFNRYNAVVVQIDDPVLAQERIVGRFRTNEPEAFARSAGFLLGARVSMDADHIRLSRR